MAWLSGCERSKPQSRQARDRLISAGGAGGSNSTARRWEREVLGDQQTPRDNPGVIALPPLLYGGTFAIALVLNWLARIPVLPLSLAFWLGLALLVAGGSLAF